MITIQLNGGLGNQMFQYACGRNLAHKHNTQLLLDTSILDSTIPESGKTKRSFALSIFGISKNDTENKKPRSIYFLLHRILNVLSLKIRGKGIQTKIYFVENKFTYNTLIEKTSKDCFLIGYWQSYSYFRNVESLIRKDFQFAPQLDEVNIEWIRKINSANSVSVHIRRTDFVNNNVHDIHGICTLEYYRDAFNKIISMSVDPVFFIFSDDVAWAINNLKLPYLCHFIDGNQGHKSYIDMQLMSHCNHNIIANSSFSWWGAWLNLNPSKIVIAPKAWFINKKLNNQTVDLIPNTWIRI